MGGCPDPDVTGNFEPIEMPFEMWTRVAPRKGSTTRCGCTLAPPGEDD